MFGGICRETKEVFLEVVPDRSGNTLWPIIRERIAPGTIILTDEARVYQNLHQANRGGFEHYSVNHSQSFVNPNDPNVYTNTIERQWGLVKRKIKGSVGDDQLPMYLAEYIYRKMNFQCLSDYDRKCRGSQFKTFLNHIIEVYPGLV